MKNLALVLLFLLPYPHLVNAQNTLKPNSPIERELSGGQVHEFSVRVEENEFVELVVEQRGIDVVVKVASPTGKSLGQFDSPNGNDGPEYVSFVAVTPGQYTITIGSLHPEHKPSGRYVIKLLEVRQATSEELKARKNLEVVKTRGITLLTEIEGLAAQIKTPQTRIRAQMQSSRILWETDEKRAAKLMGNAIAELKEIIASLDSADASYQQYATVIQLRQEIILALAERDPDAALDFLYSTSQIAELSGGQQERSMQESTLVLSIVDQIAAKHPERALQLARKTLENRFSQNLIGTVMQLQAKNRELAAELTKEITAKLLGEKFLTNVEAGNLAVSLIRLSYELSEQGTDEANPREHLLPEDKAKELLQKILDELSSYPIPSPQTYSRERSSAWNILSGLQSMGAQLDKLAPGSLAMVQKKIVDMNNGINPFVEAIEQSPIANNSVEAALEAIEKAPEELKDSMYMQLAHRELSNGDVGRAKQIVNEHVTNAYTRRQMMASFEQHEIHGAMAAGKVEDALRSVSAFRTNRERAAHLSLIIGRIGPGHKRAKAINLLEQARSMLGPSLQAQDETHMAALLEIARAFARYDSKRSFQIVDPLIDQFNEISAAARVMEGFGAEYFQNDELDLHNGSTVANVAANISTLVGQLAVINFDRAKLAADKIRLPEVRLRVYLAIAEETIKVTGEK